MCVGRSCFFACVLRLWTGVRFECELQASHTNPAFHACTTDEFCGLVGTKGHTFDDTLMFALTSWSLVTGGGGNYKSLFSLPRRLQNLIPLGSRQASPMCDNRAFEAFTDGR